MELFKQQTGTFMLHIPYRGIAPAFNDLLGGQTQAMFPGLAAALPHLRSGRVRALAVTGKPRHPQLKDVPTLDESGFKGFDAHAVVRRRRPGRHAGRHRASRSTTRWSAVLKAPDLSEKLAGRSGRAVADDARAVRPVHPRRHRALDRAGAGPQHPARLD